MLKKLSYVCLARAVLDSWEESRDDEVGCELVSRSVKDTCFV